jgi:hypothetical protein
MAIPKHKIYIAAAIPQNLDAHITFVFTVISSIERVVMAEFRRFTFRANLAIPGRILP